MQSIEICHFFFIISPNAVISVLRQLLLHVSRTESRIKFIT